MGQALVITAADTGQAELGVPRGALSPRNHNHWQGRQDRTHVQRTARRGLLSSVRSLHTGRGSL